MSHVETIKVEINDLECLKKAVENIGLKWNQDKKTYKWFGRHVGDYPIPEGFTKDDMGKCDHAISIPGNKNAYEVGVVEKNGKIHLLWDFFNKGYGLQDAIGKDGVNLSNMYTTEIAVKTMENDGYMTHRYTHPDGTIHMEFTK